MSIQFYQTVMGKRFYEHTMPELVKQLARLNDNIEHLIERLPAHTPAAEAPHEVEGTRE